MPTSGATRDERGQAGTNIRPVSGPSTGSSKNRPGNRVYRILTSSTVLLFLLFCALQLFLYHANTERTLPASRLFKRAAIAPRAADDDQDDYRSPSYLPYLEWFESSAKSQRIPYVIALLFWLVFLFAVVGIVASDFFCPCLSTISSHLGLSESVAGSTLLAFGNGSPDVFSTFAAMGAQSGSLAIGELLGAASFIISVVAGIMMLVKPFKVSRHVFIRDVAFFMLADILVLVILHDAHITQLEATALVLLYVAYVAVVGFGSWWHARRERQKELLQKARDHFADNDVTTPLRSPDLTPFTDDPPTPSLSIRGRSPTPQTGIVEDPDEEGQATVALSRPSGRGRSISIATPSADKTRAPHFVRPSLLGAIEFRDVVQSLAQNSSQRHFAQFDTSSITSPGLSEPRTIAGRQSADYPSSQAKHKRPIHHRKAASVAGVEQLTLGQNVEFDSSVWASSAEEQARLPSRKQADLIDLSSGVDDPWRASNLSSPDRPRLSIQTGREHLGEGQPSVRRVPSIVLTGEDGSVTPVRQASHSSTSSSEGSHYVVAASRPWSLPTWAQSSDRKAQTRRIAIALWRNLLPSLHEFRQKSYLGAAAGILSAPAILALNLTLPVVDEASFDDSFSDAEEKAYREAQDESFDDYEEDEEPIEEEERALWRERTRKRDERIAHRLHSPAAPSHDSSTGDSPVDLSRVDARLSAATGSSGFPWSPNTPAGDAHEDSGPTEPPPSPRGGEKQRKTDVRVEKVLTILQCALCPFFCVVALLGDQLKWWYFLVALGISFGLGGMAQIIVTDVQARGRVLFCVVGFFVAMVWLLLVVNEIVGVLRAIGHVFGLSDSILGLTVFALGNSTADLVADYTIAQMGYPVMAISACYGGPLLNILLGIGLSGSFYIAQDHRPYHIHLDPTLMTTGVGLLFILVFTLVFVVSNNYRMTRKLGTSLVLAYAALTGVNLIVEIKRLGHS